MSSFSGPKIINDSLLISFDANNIKSIPSHPGTNDHGISDWYCFVSGTAVYSCSEPNTAIYQVTDLGVVTTVVASSSSPQRGNLSVTAGYRYYGNKPINIVIEDAHHAIAPLSMADKLFIYAAQRSGAENGIVYFYAPYAAATVTMYSGGTGVNGTATSTLSLTKGQSGTFTITTLNWYYFTSTSPVVGTASQSSGGLDKTILSPAKLTSYNRFLNWYITSIGGTPTTVGSYVIADNTYPVMNQTIADGSGGDTAQGLAYEYLCDRYSWGSVLSDYSIVAPYPSTVITTYYWSGTAWVPWETHSLSGTKLSPVQVQRDGTNGPGVAATIISGGATNMASGATLWKWEGNNPFFLAINDNADDEFAVLGWMNDRNTRSVSDTDINIYDLTKTNTMTNNNLSYNNGVFSFNGSTSNITIPNIDLRRSWTAEIWFKNTSAGNHYLLGHGTTALNQGLHIWGYTSTRFGMYGNDTDFPSNPTTNVWYCYTFTYNHDSPYTKQMFINGVKISGTVVGGPAQYAAATGDLRIGTIYGSGSAGSQNGEIAVFKLYGKVLSDYEVKQNFNALRGRFGI